VVRYRDVVLMSRKFSPSSCLGKDQLPSIVSLCYRVAIMAESRSEMSRAPSPAPVKSPDAPAGSESARRTLRLLLSFSRERHTLSAKDLAESTGIPLPSVYRYVAILRDLALLIGDDQGGYRLSARFVALGQAAEAGDNLIEIADPAMRRLAAATGETVLLVRMVGDAAVCVHRIESSHRLRISYEPGQPLPLDRGASARILLGSSPPARRRAILDALRAVDAARASVLEQEIELAAQHGWATSEEEIDTGIWAAAAAIKTGTITVAALSVPSPLVRASTAAQAGLLDQVRTAAADISAAVQGRPSAS
jgi:DNA-binding IclR family transcriptional regulator